MRQDIQMLRAITIAQHAIGQAQDKVFLLKNGYECDVPDSILECFGSCLMYLLHLSDETEKQINEGS